MLGEFGSVEIQASACPETPVFQEDSLPEIFGVARKLLFSVIAESSSTALCGGSVNYCNS